MRCVRRVVVVSSSSRRRRGVNSVPFRIASQRVPLDVSQNAKRIVNATFRCHFSHVIVAAIAGTVIPYRWELLPTVSLWTCPSTLNAL